jgi:hypothetical protein
VTGSECKNDKKEWNVRGLEVKGGREDKLSMQGKQGLSFRRTETAL